jgi:molybdate transport repressor ModE-like protein
LQVHVKVWVEREGRVALSDWRIALLEQVERTGSLAEAARELNVPYRTAWYKLREMQDALGFPVLVSHSGGADHGGMKLTDEAKEAIRQFRDMTRGLGETVDTRFADRFEVEPSRERAPASP